MLDALCQCAGHGSGTTGEIDRSIPRLRLGRLDDERDDTVGVKFWSNGEASGLPAELVSDRAFMGVGIFRSHRPSDRDRNHSTIVVPDVPLQRCRTLDAAATCIYSPAGARRLEALPFYCRADDEERATCLRCCERGGNNGIARG